MNREWMYRRFTSDGYISPEFHQGLESFIQFACGQPRFMDGDKIRCPCRKCKNLAFRDLDTVRLHVCSKGFVFNYHVWSVQGERRNVVQRPNVVGSTTAAGPSQYRQMIIDVAAASMFNMDSHINVDEAIDDSEADKSYTTAKAKRIAEEVECGLEDLNQSLPDGVSPTPADMTEIFIGAAQNPKKNRVFGVGTLYSPPSVNSRWETGGSGFPSMGIDDERYQKLQAEYQAEKEQRQALERRQGGLEESHQQLEQSHHQLLDEFKQTKLLLERLLRRDTQTDE